LRLGEVASDRVRLLGPDQVAISPMGISGHYGLPVEGFVRAYDSGVNLMFWEPNYGSMNECFTRLTPRDRRAIHVIAGTFEATGPRVQRDAELALRMLRIERLALFLIFWVQSWDRITPDVRLALETLKSSGKIAAFGLSTHSRSLALEAIDAGWDPVMVRHSAAHRGAEQHVFPRAVERGTSLITFSNTCYGRLLEPQGEWDPPDAADCYRYTLMQPGVRACLSAPRTLMQLDANLSALRDPALPEERRQYLQAFGDRLYQEETMFWKFVRNL
jgi:aryl-alcohol dehydrogenase-like predicted oxidoreductase